MPCSLVPKVMINTYTCMRTLSLPHKTYSLMHILVHQQQKLKQSTEEHDDTLCSTHTHVVTEKLYPVL